MSSESVEVVRKRLAQVRRQQMELEVEARVLGELLKAMDGGEAGAAEHPASLDQRQPAEAHDLPGPRDAIIDLLGRHPGLTPTQLADRLEHRVTSTAKDKRNVLRTTAATLVKVGKVRKGPGNKLYLEDHPMSA